MILDLQLLPTESLEIRINGKTAAEIAVNQLTLIDPNLLAAARANNALRHIARAIVAEFESTASGKIVDHSVSAKDRLDVLLEALQDGIAGRKVTYGAVGVPDTLPGSGATYYTGYQAGRALSGAMKQASLLDMESEIEDEQREDFDLHTDAFA